MVSGGLQVYNAGGGGDGMCGPHRVGQFGRESRDTWALTACGGPWVSLSLFLSTPSCSQHLLSACCVLETTMGRVRDSCPQIAHSLVEKPSQVRGQSQCRGKSKESQKGSPGGGTWSQGRFPGENRAGVESQRMQRSLPKHGNVLGKEDSRFGGPDT